MFAALILLFSTYVHAGSPVIWSTHSGAASVKALAPTICFPNGNCIDGSTGGAVMAVTASSPLFSSSGSTPNITCQTATSSLAGCLAAADFATFLAKEPAISAGTTSQYWRGDKTFQTLNTAAVPELTNLYWTQARFDTAFGGKTTSNLIEGSNLYYTQGRFDSAFTAKSTTNLSEGSNLYYTAARAKADAVVNTLGGSQTDQAPSVVSVNTALALKVSSTRAVNTTAPLTGGGDLSGDRTIAIPLATNSVDGYLSAADRTAFNAAAAAVTAATAVNTASTIVKRDGSGGFAAGTITSPQVSTAPVTVGNASTAAMIVQTGASTSSGSGNTGGLTVKTGDLSNGSGSTGEFDLFTGNNNSTGASGNFIVVTGQTSSAASGILFMETGGTNSGSSGGITLQSGSGNTGTGSSTGGISLGSGNAGSGGSGNVALFTGPSTGGTQGTIQLQGVAWPNTAPTTGQVLTATSPTDTAWTTPAGGGGGISNGGNSFGSAITIGTNDTFDTIIEANAIPVMTFSSGGLTSSLAQNLNFSGSSSRQNIMSNGNVIIDFGDSIMKSNSGSAWVDYGSRVLQDSGGNSVVFWQSSGLRFADASKGIVYAAGSNARAGKATLSTGTVTVSNTSVTANSLILLTPLGGTVGNLFAVSVTNVVAGTSFDIISGSALDARVVQWMIVESQ